MFANGSVQAFAEKVRRLDAGPCSVHSVVERVAVMSDDGMQHAWVVATNVYAKTAQGWRMVAHHASPGTRTEPVEVLTAQPVLH
jgi:ketosteroid isomerase-like protein